MSASTYLGLIDLSRLAGLPRTRGDEYEDLRALLVEHAAAQDAPTSRLAQMIALACLGENHLWQDLGLSSRQLLSSLMRENFPRLFYANSGNMRWKKFFYRELCQRAGIRVCRSPSCAECSEMAVCFGPEADTAAAVPVPAAAHRFGV